MKPIYLDYNATTPIDPRVSKIICDSINGDDFGNPSSTHAYGKAAKAIVETARQKLAKAINAEPEEIIFTGGGTEASNQAILATMMFGCVQQPLGKSHRPRMIVNGTISH